MSIDISQPPLSANNFSDIHSYKAYLKDYRYHLLEALRHITGRNAHSLLMKYEQYLNSVTIALCNIKYSNNMDG